MEKVMIEHPFHEHRLILRDEVVDNESIDCYGCGNPIGKKECVYICVEENHCSVGIIFHKRCGELPTQISHHSHPHHPLYLFDFGRLGLEEQECHLCDRPLVEGLAYRCSDCNFNIDTACKKMGTHALREEPRQLTNSGHIHPLKLMMLQPFEFNCHGCGTRGDRDMMYSCSTCDFLIHKSCALLPRSHPTNYHHHELSLSSSFPIHHRNHGYRCSLCGEDFNFVSWVYFCDDCKFFAHVKCVTSELQLPLEGVNIYKDLIRPFVIRELNRIPGDNDMPPSRTVATTAKKRLSFLFNSHMHKTLKLFSSELSNQDDDDDDDEMEMKICDECTTLISPPYYKCDSCDYFVHAICLLVPDTLSPLQSQPYGNCPITHKPHTFRNYTSTKRNENMSLGCEICRFATNGMVYLCEECKMTIDMKCACLPTTIKHASHPHQKLKKTKEEERREDECHGCRVTTYRSIRYLCQGDGCDFALCSSCILLPQSVMKRELDSHPLSLKYDASSDHASDFYCEICEEDMNTKKWMYHCRSCDNSFHPRCLDTVSGVYKNIKFGSELKMVRFHSDHLLTFSYITLRNTCNNCGDGVYSYLGFVCSPCNYAVCISCGLTEFESAEENM